MPSVAIIGASSDREKFGNKAVRAYILQGYTVYPVNPRQTQIEGLKVYASVSDVPGKIDRIAMYVPPEAGITLLPEIAAAKPAEFFVNPGAESDELIEKAYALGLEPILACAIADIGDSPSVL
jgi:uncharacterized protein